MDIHYSDILKHKHQVAFNIMVKTTGPICNLNCTYCYYIEREKSYGHSRMQLISDQVLEAFVKQYIETQNVPLISFVWQGGEPLYAGFDFFEKVIRVQNKYKIEGKTIENVLQTNAVIINDEWCEFFKKHDFLIGVSVDGPEHLHDFYRKTKAGQGTFQKVMKAIELLKKYQVRFNTLTTVNKNNCKHPLEIYNFLKSIGSQFMQFLPVVERRAVDITQDGLELVSNDFKEASVLTDWSVPAKAYGEFMSTIFDSWVRRDVGTYFVQLFDVSLANWYGAPPGLCVFSETCGEALVMEQNGDLYSCDHFVYPQYKIGNLLETSAFELLKSDKQFQFGTAKRTNLTRQCKNCKYLFACHGECPKHRFISTAHGEYGLNYLCEGYFHFFDHVKPYMDFMVKELTNERPPANVMQWIRNKESQVINTITIERNDNCFCGSGKKYKKCCGKILG